MSKHSWIGLFLLALLTWSALADEAETDSPEKETANAHVSVYEEEDDEASDDHPASDEDEPILSESTVAAESDAVSPTENSLAPPAAEPIPVLPPATLPTPILPADTAPPIITVPADVTADAVDAAGTTVDYPLPTVTDAIDASPTIACSPASGTVFPLGNTSVQCVASDAAGNTAQAVLNITVVAVATPTPTPTPPPTLPTDTVPPVVTPPVDQQVEATAVLTPVTVPAATATDAVDGALAASNNAPAEFPLGTTAVTHTATDQAGNTGSAQHAVTVQDTAAPQLTAPPGITASALDGNPLTLNLGQATATDIFPVTITHNAPVQFPLGTTIIQWTAVDSSGNSAVATQTVNVTAPAAAPAPAPPPPTPPPASPVTPDPAGPVVLPPDPGPAGELTLAGIDSDSDGVRDDVQRWIAMNYPNSAKIRAALRQSAKWNQKSLLAADNPQLYLQYAHESGDGITCLAYIDPDNFVAISDKLDALFYNTLERVRKLFLADSRLGGHVFSDPPMSQWKQTCDFAPDLLPN